MGSTAPLRTRSSTGFSAFVVIVACAAQPALKFFVSPLFGPAKDILVGGLLLVGAACLIGRARPRRYDLRGTDAWLVGGIVLLVALYVVNLAGSFGAAWASSLRLVVLSWGLFLLGLATTAARQALRWALRALIVVGVAEAALGVWQQTVGSTGLILRFGYAFGAQVRLDPTGHFRSFGTFEDPFHYGAVLVIALTAVCFGSLRDRSRLFLVPILGIGIYVSHVRTSQAIAVVVLAAWLVHRRPRPWIVLVCAALAMGALMYASAPSDSAAPAPASADGGSLLDLNGRLEGWGSLFGAPDDVVFGNGVGERGSGLARSQSGTIAELPRFEPGKPPAPPPFLDATFVDSTYLGTASDLGVVGLLLLVAILARIAVLFGRTKRLAPVTSALGLALLFVVATDAFTRSSLNAFPVGFIALHVLGLALGAAVREARQPEDGVNLRELALSVHA